MIYDFTPDEQARLSPYVTNTDRSIFGLRNLPEAVKAALFARYSRTNKDLRRVLLDEFLPVLHRAESAKQSFDTAGADAFHDRVINEYGDDSVAELGGAHIAVEGVSQLAALALCDNRIGMSPLVKSTRYVDFGKKINGRYQYHLPAMEPEEEIQATAAMDGLFDAYVALLPKVTTYLEQVNPRRPEIDEKPYKRAIKARALDALRGLLPMGTATNMGLYGNGRAFDHLLAKLGASDHKEHMLLSMAICSELQQLIPSLLKKQEYRSKQRIYLKDINTSMHKYTDDHNYQFTKDQCLLIESHGDVSELAANILYPHTNIDVDMIRRHIDAGTFLQGVTAEQIFRDYIGKRPTRHVRPGRALEKVRYTFDLVTDIGCHRDLQRHRMTEQSRQQLTCNLGHSVPELVQEAGLGTQYQQSMLNVWTAHSHLHPLLGEKAEYLVPMGFRIHWQMTLNLREAYHLIELRTQPNGHQSYRAIAQQMYHQIKAVHPWATDGMTFVDLNDYELGRLSENVL